MLRRQPYVEHTILHIRFEILSQITDDIARRRADQRERGTLAIGDSPVHAGITTAANGHERRMLCSQKIADASLKDIRVQRLAEAVPDLAIKRISLQRSIFPGSESQNPYTHEVMITPIAAVQETHALGRSAHRRFVRRGFRGHLTPRNSHRAAFRTYHTTISRRK